MSGRKEALGRERLLAGEDLDDGGVPMTRRFHDNAGVIERGRGLTPSPSPALPLLRSRGSETGSIFHEGVWPPPGAESRMVDPLSRSGEVDLGRIVDDVMGPERAPSIGGSWYAHERGQSGDSLVDPFRDLSHSSEGTGSPYSGVLAAAGLSNPGPPSYASGGASSTSLPQPQSYPSSLLGLPAGAATPKKPSPLATSIPTSAQTTNWLSRSPKRTSMTPPEPGPNS